MKIIIAGSRGFSNAKLLEKEVDAFIAREKIDEVVIVSGGAGGADALGELYAKKKGYLIQRFPANWKEFGKNAGIRRNIQMAEFADALIAFWDNESRGTHHMITVAKQCRLNVKVVNYDAQTQMPSQYNKEQLNVFKQASLFS